MSSPISPNTSPAPIVRDGFTNLLVRRAFYNAIDRASLAETVTGGLAPVPDSSIPPNHELRPFVEDVISQFAYEPARAMELLGQAGWAAARTAR